MSLYNEEDRNSLYAVTDCLQILSELDFDFGDIVVNSTAYRRVLAAAKQPACTAKQDDSEGLVEVADDLVHSPIDLEYTFTRVLRRWDINDRDLEAMTDH